MTISSEINQQISQSLCGKGWKVLLTSPQVQLWSKSADTSDHWSIGHQRVVTVLTDRISDGQCLVRVYDQHLNTIHFELDLRQANFSYEPNQSDFHVFKMAAGWTGIRFGDRSDSNEFKSLVYEQQLQRLKRLVVRGMPAEQPMDTPSVGKPMMIMGPKVRAPPSYSDVTSVKTPIDVPIDSRSTPQPPVLALKSDRSAEGLEQIRHGMVSKGTATVTTGLSYDNKTMSYRTCLDGADDNESLFSDVTINGNGLDMNVNALVVSAGKDQPLPPLPPPPPALLSPAASNIPSLVTTASKRQKWTIESWTQTEPLVTTTTTPAQEISHKEVLDRALKAMSAAIHFIQTHDISTPEELVTRNVPKVKQCYGLDTVDEIPDEVIEKCVDYSTADAILSSAAVLDQLMATKSVVKSRHKLANNGCSVPTIPKEIAIFTENDGNGGKEVDVYPKSIDISLAGSSSTAKQMMPMSVPLVEWSAGGDIGKCCLTDSKPSDQLVSTKMAKKLKHLLPGKEEEEYEEVSDNDKEEEAVITTTNIPIDLSLRHTSLTGCDGEETSVKRKQWSSAEICTNPCPLSSTDEDNDQMLDQTHDESMDKIVDEIFNGILDEELTNQIPDMVKKETSVARSDNHSSSLTYVPSLRSSAEEEVDGNGIHVCGGGGDDKQIPRSLARELNRWEQTFSRLDWKRMSITKKCTPVAQVVGHKASPTAPVVETGIPDHTVDYHLRQLSQLLSSGSGTDAQHRDWWTHTGDCPPTYVTVAAVKRWVKHLGPYCRPVSMVFLDVFVWAPRLSTKWSVHWPAALCLLEDRRRCGYYLRVYDKNFHRVLWERQLTVDVEHRALDVRLHEVRFGDCRAGLAFQSAGKGFEFALSVRHVLSGLDERLERLRAAKVLEDREMNFQSKRQANGFGKWFGHWFTASGKATDKGSVVGDVLAYESDTTKALIDNLLIHPAIKGLIIAMIDKHRAAAVGMAGGLALNRRVTSFR
ncbi:unnamed protein product [Medioppia subpectinata]|uniref:WH1 domain-containing protein n=1 Tax=Medioppia subpectinata TaxID=1979941 RepID=A0A7R9L033_9ACAR|nr:unnamed protein product [Medioppia subpectinata]CAG2112647.1 unnamed protein product [Medioppia subpectinata]